MISPSCEAIEPAQRVFTQCPECSPTRASVGVGLRDVSGLLTIHRSHAPPNEEEVIHSRDDVQCQRGQCQKEQDPEDPVWERQDITPAVLGSRLFGVCALSS